VNAAIVGSYRRPAIKWPVFASRADWQTQQQSSAIMDGCRGDKLMTDTKRSRAWHLAFLGLILAGGLAPSVGCQVSVAGQTLPSPYYLYDDVQYFPAGSENKLANETAAMKKARADAVQRGR